jgi:predicted negative regulator of RcsB-dependent stress response
MTFIVGVILGGLVVLVWGAQEAVGKESLRSAAAKQEKAAGAGAAGRGSRRAVSPKAAPESGS